MKEEIYSKYEIDGIINFAAESHVDRSNMIQDISKNKHLRNTNTATCI